MTEFDPTTEIVRRARAGDPGGLEELVVRFSPWLLVQARHRLAGRLRNLVDAEDLVHDVWMAALPHIPNLRGRGGRWTPSLAKFLSVTLIRRLADLIEKHIAGKPERAPLHEAEELSASVTQACGRTAVRERAAMLWDALATLSERERHLIVLRGLERHPFAEVGAILGIETNAANVAYRRARNKLRERLAPLLLADFAE